MFHCFPTIHRTFPSMLNLAEIPTKQKHSFVEETIFDHIKHTKLTTTALSTTGQPSKYEHIQRMPSKQILDDCPEPDADIPPILLLYDGFGQFLDIVDGSNTTLGLSEVNMVEL